LRLLGPRFRLRSQHCSNMRRLMTLLTEGLAGRIVDCNHGLRITMQHLEGGSPRHRHLRTAAMIAKVEQRGAQPRLHRVQPDRLPAMPSS
jgi:hypothetical protein